MTLRLIDCLSTTEPLAEVFSDRHVMTSMLAFEIALAGAEARRGLIPAAAAEHIAAAAADVDAFDAQAIARAAPASATLGVPFVETLRRRVEARDASSAVFVHWGATSQDVTDTALALCLAAAHSILEADHQALSSGLRRLSNAHAGTVMLARTLLQPATASTFGLKAAGWWSACDRSWRGVRSAFEASRALQLGGASGTLAALGEHGASVADDMANVLSLAPAAPWHVHRDRLTTLVAACGVYVASLTKVARDIALLMQAEVAEVREAGGGSSSMPHKQNAAGCAVVMAAAAPVAGLVASALTTSIHEHERGLGAAPAEMAIVAQVVQATGAALAALGRVIDTLHVDVSRMHDNLQATQGVVYADKALRLLGPRLGLARARQVIDQAVADCRSHGQRFAEALTLDAGARDCLSAAELITLDSPDEDLTCAERMRHRHLNPPA